MAKGAATREYILRKAAEVFNLHGYYGTSMSDIMAATGLEKGGIYNHFAGKDDLALQAYEYAVDLMRQEFTAALKGRYHARDRLVAVISVFARLPDDMPLPGGCPVINTAVQATNSHDKLHASARRTLQEWHDLLVRILQAGIERDQIKPDVDPQSVATLIVSALEGAIVVSRVKGDPRPMEVTVAHLLNHIEQVAR